MSNTSYWYFVSQPKRATERRAAMPWRAWRRVRDKTYSAGWPTALLFSEALIDSRIGRTTNSASATTRKFISEAATNTECQLPEYDFRRLASGTTKADTPFAVYNRLVLVVAYFGPNMSVQVEGNRLK